MSSHFASNISDIDAAFQTTQTRLPYRPRAMQVAMALVFFGACGAFCAHWASNKRGLIIDGLLNLDPRRAAIFKMALAVVSFGMCLFAALFLVPQSLRRSRQIVLDHNAIHVPVWHAWTDAASVIDASQLNAIRVLKYKQATFLRLHHPGGVARINSKHLDHDDDVETILQWLGQRRPDLIASTR